MEDPNTNTQQTPLEKNLSYLEKQLEFLGFGEDVKNLFLTEMETNKNKENFDVAVTQSFSTPLTKKDDPSTRSTATYQLHYHKDKRENVADKFFFLNSYDVSNKENTMKMYVSSEKKNFTMKEAFNLLEGRSVYKKDLVKMDGDKYNAWINFDFKHLTEKNTPSVNRYTDKFGFDISKELKKLYIKENNYNDRHNQLVDSLKKGNLQAVTAIVNGKEKQMYIEAKPQFKNFNLYEVNEKNKLVSVKTDTIIKPPAEDNGESETNKVEGKNAESMTAEKNVAENNTVENNETEEHKETEKETRRTGRRR
jgi:hypothetical protein